MSFGDDTLDPSVSVEAQLRAEIKRVQDEIAGWQARYERDVAIDPAEAEHLRTVAHELRLTADVFEAERDRLREQVEAARLGGISARSVIAGLHSDLNHLREQLAKHEKCVEEFHADQLAIAERDNELHEEKDALIVALRKLVDLHQLSEVWADQQVAACEIQRLQMVNANLREQVRRLSEPPDMARAVATMFSKLDDDDKGAFNMLVYQLREQLLHQEAVHGLVVHEVQSMRARYAEMEEQVRVLRLENDCYRLNVSEIRNVIERLGALASTAPTP